MNVTSEGLPSLHFYDSVLNSLSRRKLDDDSSA